MVIFWFRKTMGFVLIEFKRKAEYKRKALLTITTKIGVFLN